MNTTISLEDIEEIHFEATLAAEQAAARFFQEKLGGQDQMACGFAWVTVFEKASTKLGKALMDIGFTKDYYGGLTLWDPSNSCSQSMDLKEAGSRAYADVFVSHGIKAYMGSRAD